MHKLYPPFLLGLLFAAPALAQNVGINTTTPDRPLTIQPPSGQFELLSLKNNTGATKFHYNFYNGSLNLVETGVQDFRLLVQPGGNIGLGVSSPNQLLELGGQAAPTLLLHSNSNNLFTGATLQFRESDLTYGWNLRHNSGASEGGSIHDRLVLERVQQGNPNLPTMVWDQVTGNVGVGTNAPVSSAALDVTSTTQGVLLPRLTTAQMYAIAAPVPGLMVYNTTANAFYGYKGPTTASTLDQPTTNGYGISTTQLGQSFTASTTTNLTSVTYYLLNSPSTSSTLILTLYLGNGFNGTALYTTSQAVSSTAEQAYTFPISPALALTAGQSYTFGVSRADNGVIGGSFANNNPYAGGEMYYKNATGTGVTYGTTADIPFKLTFNTGTWQVL